MEVQTRSSCGELKYFASLREAQDYAEKNQEVWKISFAVESGERVRLVKRGTVWVWEDIMREVEKQFSVVVEPLDYGIEDMPLDYRGIFEYRDQFTIAGRGLVFTGVLL
ncbi:MAG: hypothetical protein ACWGQW_24815, partial [bacterium]